MDIYEIQYAKTQAWQREENLNNKSGGQRELNLWSAMKTAVRVQIVKDAKGIK